MLHHYNAQKNKEFDLKLDYLNASYHTYLKNCDLPGDESFKTRYKNLIGAVNALWGDDTGKFQAYLNPDFQLYYFDTDSQHNIYANGIPVNPFSEQQYKMPSRLISLADLAKELKATKCIAAIENKAHEIENFNAFKRSQK